MKTLSTYLNESFNPNVNESKKTKQWSDVKVGDIGVDYNNEKVEILAIAKNFTDAKKNSKFKHELSDIESMIDDGTIESSTPLVMVTSDNGTACFVYDGDGVLVYESVNEGLSSSDLKKNETYLVTQGDTEAYAEYIETKNGFACFDNSGEILKVKESDVAKNVMNESKQESLNESVMIDIMSGLSKDETTLLLGAIFAVGFIATSAGITKLIEYLKKNGGSKVKAIINKLEELGGSAGAIAQQR